MSYLQKLFGIEKKTAVVTGGTGVLGSAMCKALAAAGARIVILARRKDASDALANEIEAVGCEAIAISADVLDREQLIAARKTILDHFASIDILVNGAG